MVSTEYSTFKLKTEPIRNCTAVSAINSRRKRSPSCEQQPRSPRRFVCLPMVFIISISLTRSAMSLLVAHSKVTNVAWMTANMMTHRHDTTRKHYLWTFNVFAWRRSWEQQNWCKCRDFLFTGSHYILVVKFKDFSRTFKDPKVAFSRTNFRWSLQQYLISISLITVTVLVDKNKTLQLNPVLGKIPDRFVSKAYAFKSYTNAV